MAQTGEQQTTSSEATIGDVMAAINELAAAVQDLGERVAKLEPDAGPDAGAGNETDGGQDGERMDAIVRERVALATTAQRVLGEEVRVDGMSAREIRAAVLAKLEPQTRLDGRSDEYVAARFDAAVERYDRGDKSEQSPIVQARADAFTPPATPAAPTRDVAPRLEDKWKAR